MDYDVYLHTLYTSRFYKTKTTLELLKKILDSNSILSRKQQGMSGSYNFCGEDYIALTDLEKRNITLDNKDYNSYNLFVKSNTSIIFPKDKFNVIEPIILDKPIGIHETQMMKEMGISETDRFTDLPDEVQVKDKLSLDYMIGIMIPLYEKMVFWRNNDKNRDIIKKEIEAYKSLLLSYGKDIPIYDTISMEKLDNDDGITSAIYALRLYNKK